MLGRYHKERAPMYAPLETSHLGYASDNGAFYYYNPLPNQTYEATFLAVQRYFQSQHIPYRHLELDSFWYYKASGGGVQNWTAMPSAFPSGLVKFHQELGLPLIAHNRWWAPKPSYAKQQGGAYEWIEEAEHSVPNDAQFWLDLFANATEWGLEVYLQDWLNQEFTDTTALHTQIGLARTWLMQMGHGANASGMVIQYCTPLIRQLLQSVEIEAVRQSRASSDYEPGRSEQWDIRYMSLLLFSLGVAAHKDVWWSTASQPGNPYTPGYEPNPDLQALVATLSAGPVMPGDGIGYTNVSLVNMSCRADGLLLKPDRPAFPSDEDFVGWAFDPTYNETVGRRSITYTHFSNAAGDYTLLMSLQALHDCNQSSPSPSPTPPRRTVRQMYLGIGIQPSAVSFLLTFYYSASLQAATSSRGLTLPPTDLRLGLDEEVPDPFQVVPSCGFLYTRVRPCLGVLCVVGEVDKWVSMSKQRVVGFMQDGKGATLTLSGVEGETVHMGYEMEGEGMVRVADCQFGPSGSLALDWQVASLPNYTCTATPATGSSLAEDVRRTSVE